MSEYYIPCTGDTPAALVIKGHKLIVLAKEKSCLEDDLESVGADNLKVIKVEDSEVAEQKFFANLAEKNSAGVLILPAEATYSDLMRSLEDQLPWLQ